MAGRTKAQLASGQVRSLRAMRKKLLAMAAEWGDVDGYSETLLTELADKAEATAMQMVEAGEEDS